MATVLDQNAFLLDNGTILYRSDKQNYLSFESGERVYLNFSYLETYSNHITIHYSYKVHQGILNVVSSDEISKSVNDLIRLESIWMGGHYLNLQFYITFKSEAHKISLIADESKINGSDIEIYFRHDINNDPPGYPALILTSYDLKEVLGEPKGDRKIWVHLNTSNYGDETFQYIY